MKLSKKWLQEYVFLPDSLSAQELAQELTLRTVEVEGIENQAESLNHIVVGVIVQIEKHENADKLKVVDVDAGDEVIRVVCGGMNLKIGMKVALAKVGASVLWHGEGDRVVLEPAVVRGVESQGMICASDEIGVSHLFPKSDEREILDLNHLNSKPGTPLSRALELDDVILEVDNKSLSNRPDLWGHIGMAREIAAMYRKKLELPEPPKIEAGTGKEVSVSIESEDLCPRYMAVALDGITIAPSPQPIQKRLEACGIRPINNIVDITNLVMLEIGQPTHAFDAKHLEGKSLVVRRAKEGETFVTLDEKEHTLTKDMLMITDGERSLALAGIMGGLNSGITENTTSVIFESANFDASSIRKTSTRLGLRTDSSMRFEKSLDPQNAEIALRRLVQLTLEVCPDARVVSPVVDVAKKMPPKMVIETSWSVFEKKIGIALDHKLVIDRLERLGFVVDAGKKDTLKITVPSWRATKDISLPEDIIEEVIRFWGYENIPATLPEFSIHPPKRLPVRVLERRIREILALEAGYTETYNYSFESPSWLDRLGVDRSLHLELENPIAKDRPLIRRSLIPNLLENVEYNAHRLEKVALFELGRTYKIEQAGERTESGSGELLPRQNTFLGVVYSRRGEAVPFFELSDSLQHLFDRLHVSFELKTEMEHDLGTTSWKHPGRYAVVVVNETPVGILTELHPHIGQQVGIEERVAVLEINLSLLAEVAKEEVLYEPLLAYPEVTRDIAFVVPKETAHARIVEILRGIDPLLQAVELFDVYEGEHVPSGKKSMAYHLVYRSSEKTLTTQEVDAVHKKVVKQLEKECGAEIRK